MERATLTRMPTNPQHTQDLYKLLARAKTEKDMRLLLGDLLSPKELATIAERWQLVQMLSEGVPQRSIAKALGISISKVTRGSLALKRSRGGFRKFMKKKSLRRA